MKKTKVSFLVTVTVAHEQDLAARVVTSRARELLDYLCGGANGEARSMIAGGGYEASVSAIHLHNLPCVAPGS